MGNNTHSTIAPLQKSQAAVVNNNLEIFSLIWLDANVNVKESRDAQEKLRTIINNLKRFQNAEECQQYIEQTSKEDRLVLIVSGQLGRKIVPFIHKLQQISSIYVYCVDKESNEQWVCNFAKVKAVIVEADELVARIKADHKIHKTEEPLPINVFTISDGTNKTTTEINGQFVYFHLLIDCILRLKSNKADMSELISLCKKEYEGNKLELANIQEFESSYSSDKALWWYSRESFLYKTLNKALRSQNIHMIFLYRSIIADIYHQLGKNQSNCRLIVYRSQLMSSEELNSLKKYTDQFISVHSFLSTSIDRSIALFYMGDKTQRIDLERVLFEIDADSKIVTTKPFANISKHSDFEVESEVLFMAGSIFCVNNIIREDDQMWIIKMSLCSDSEHDLRRVLAHMKNQHNGREPNLLTLAKLLWNMGKLELTEKYYMRFLGELSSNDPMLSTIYEDLANLTSQRGTYDISMQWRQKAIEVNEPNSQIDDVNKNGANGAFLPLSRIGIPLNPTYKNNSTIVAGGNGRGNRLNQLNEPWGLYVDDDQNVYVADRSNHRIVKWGRSAISGENVAGGNGLGNRLHHLSYPSDVIMGTQTNSLIICTSGNYPLIRWSYENGKNKQMIISKIKCYSVKMDNNKFLYIATTEQHAVKRLRMNGDQITVVAGGNDCGNHLDQLNCPRYVFVDQDDSVFVSDENNHRVMKWTKDTEQGIIVAGGHGNGNAFTQLSYPRGLVVDTLGTVYVADYGNHRIMRWPKEATQGTVVADAQTHQLLYPVGLSLDRYGYLYVVECGNHRVQRFSINCCY